MPTSISDLFKSIGQNFSGIKTVQWGTPINCSEKGVYIISTHSNPKENKNLLAEAPIENKILEFWIKKVPTLEIDKQSNVTIAQLKKRLSCFWLPDENILYIGQTESEKGIKGRVRQYYNTELGEKKPHAGGHWIKTLQNLNQLYVHYLPVSNPLDVKNSLLKAFISQVSTKTKENIYDPKLPLPFANLELSKGEIKKHGILKSKLQ